MQSIYADLLDSANAVHTIITSERETLMAIVNAYFDESGKLADTEHVCFGGIIAAEADMKSLSMRWTALLNDSGIKYLRTVEAINLRGQFYGWKNGREDERDELLLSLARLAVEFGAYMVCSASSSEEFKALPIERQKQLENPMYCGFEACVGDIAEIVQSHTKKNLVHLWCDSSQEYARRCLELYSLLKHRRQDVQDTFVAITFADDKQFPPLQAADLYAYCHRRFESSDLRPKIVDEVLAILDEKSERSQFGYKRGKGLGFGQSVP